MQSFPRNSPLERGTFSIVEMEKAGCVKIRIAVVKDPLLTFVLKSPIIPI
jgi:hypothetical protein